MWVGISRINADRFLIIALGLREILLRPVGVPAIVVGEVVVRIQADGFRVVRDGSILVIHVMVGQSSVVIPGGAGIQANSLGEISDGVIQTSLPSPGRSSNGPSPIIAWVGLNSLAEIRQTVIE